MRTSFSTSADTVSTTSDLPCTADSGQAAKDDQNRARTDIVRMLPPAARQNLVNAFRADDGDPGRRSRHPWQELQRQEAHEVDEIATAAIGILFGTRAGFTNRQAADLEQGATYLV